MRILSRVITEGLAAGRPLILSENPSIKKVLGEDYPLLIPHNDVENVRRVLSTATREGGSKFTNLMEKMYGDLKDWRAFLGFFA